MTPPSATISEFRPAVPCHDTKSLKTMETKMSATATLPSLANLGPVAYHAAERRIAQAANLNIDALAGRIHGRRAHLACFRRRSRRHRRRRGRPSVSRYERANLDRQTIALTSQRVRSPTLPGSAQS